MKIVFLSGSRSSAAGGIFEVERSLAQKLSKRYGFTVEAAGLLDAGTARDESAWDFIRIHCYPIVGPKQFGYSPKLTRWLRSTDFDLLHLHNLWMYTSFLALDWHQRSGRPFIVSPHGMLDPWALKNSGWKKRLAGILYEKRMLRKAALIHAFHAKDVADIRSYGLRNPIAVIPNGVELPNVSTNPMRREKRLLFLGRLHPKKGLVELIQAWGVVPAETRAGWRLTIAGWDDGGHMPGLIKQVEMLDLGQSVEFTGPTFGTAKQALLETSSGFILPSFSEGLPMTVLEAWANSLPVIMTDMCNLPQGFASSAAIKIAPNSTSIAQGLAAFFDMSVEDRHQMGTAGRQLVERQFTWDKVSDDLAAAYRWISRVETRPDFIQTVD